MSNSNKHTPGPWQMHVCDKAIATITGDTRGWGHDHLAYVPMSLAPEREANARLIAAAPEMLEALLAVQANDKLMNALNRQDRKTLELIQASIAKATGGAS